MTVTAMKRGACDFLTKPVRDLDLMAAIKKALEQDLAARRDQNGRDQFNARLGALTPREREVLGHVAVGLLNKQIAALLGTSEKTIKVHRARVMEKMRVQSLAELVRLVERSRVDDR
jgi:FixJ family two-component response regulator